MAGFPPNLPQLASASPAAMPLPQGTPTPTSVMAPRPAPTPAGPQMASMGDNLQQMLMVFLAGMGFPHFEAAITKLRKGPNDTKAGIRKDAAMAPQQQMNPLMAQMMAKAAAAKAGLPQGLPPTQGLPPIGG